MKKIIALAVLGLAVSACDFDLREDETAATAVKYAMVTGRSVEADVGQAVPGSMNGPWVVEAAPFAIIGTPSRRSAPTATNPTGVGTYGRIVMFTTNGLLDGASIEATPNSCIPTGATAGDPTSNGWLNVTPPAGSTLAGGRWYACYYPSSSTTDDGASVFVYYSTVAPGTGTNNQPIRAGYLVPGEYTFGGTVKSKNGSDFPLAASVTIAEVWVSSEDADDEIAPGATNTFDATLANLTPGVTDWALEVVNADTGAAITGANAGTLDDVTDTDTVVYTAPATVPAADPLDPFSIGGIYVTVTATNGSPVDGSGGPWTNSYTIWVAP